VGVVRETTYTFTATRETAAEDEFTLSAYGLPEPVGMERRTRFGLWVWMSGFALAFVVITAGFAALRRRVAGRRSTAHSA
jgi:hypothetical protein